MSKINKIIVNHITISGARSISAVEDNNGKNISVATEKTNLETIE